MTEKRGAYGQRYSKCAEWALRRRLEELRAMTPLERVILALSLKERSRAIRAGVDATKKMDEP